MVKKADVEPQLAQLMDSVPEVEGIAAVDRKQKKVIVAQTITDMPHDEIANNTIATVEHASKLGAAIEKGKVTELSLKAVEGYCVIVGNDELILMVLTGSDAASSVGLILRNLRVILEKL